MLPALHTFLRCYCMTGRYAEALKELQTSIFADAELPVLFPIKIQILIVLSQFDVARAAFSLYMQHAGDLESLEILFTHAARLHEGWRLTEIQIDILRRLDALPASATLDNTASVNVLRARIKLALKNIAMSACHGCCKTSTAHRGQRVFGISYRGLGLAAFTALSVSTVTVSPSLVGANTVPNTVIIFPQCPAEKHIRSQKQKRQN